MDSQVTLVNASVPLCLTFSKGSMINTTLYLDSDSERRPVYTICTPLRGTVTEIRSATGGTEGELVARICRNDFLPNTVAFKDGKSVRLASWLKKFKLPDGSTARIVETAVGNCFLKIDRKHRLALYSASDLECTTPLAHWARSPETGQLQLSLNLPAGMEDFRPQIIAAFTVEELKMRGTEKYDTVQQAHAAVRNEAVKDLLGVGRGH
ncbi:hypothetical protein DFH06DRAFT_1360880 [Mycena polygramma]|nr:hypothetical protein DFH06DRAFT_1360880 [Mycena polygramma]